MNVLLELAIDDVGEDLKLPVRMCAKAGASCNAVFVDDPQATERAVGVVLIAREVERVERLQPVCERRQLVVHQQRKREKELTSRDLRGRALGWDEGRS
jgi:hypothetical protein